MESRGKLTIPMAVTSFVLFQTRSLRRRNRIINQYTYNRIYNTILEWFLPLGTWQLKWELESNYTSIPKQMEKQIPRHVYFKKIVNKTGVKERPPRPTAADILKLLIQLSTDKSVRTSDENNLFPTTQQFIGRKVLTSSLIFPH